MRWRCAAVPELLEVGVSEDLFRRQALLRVVDTHLVDDVDTLGAGVRQLTLDARTLLGRKVKIHRATFTVKKTKRLYRYNGRAGPL